jgi:hypothetical protein
MLTCYCLGAVRGVARGAANRSPGRTAHLPVFHAGTFCERCCPTCRRDPAEIEEVLEARAPASGAGKAADWQ